MGALFLRVDVAGRRWSTTTKEFFTIATVIGGPRLTEFLTDNIGGPGLTTVEAQRAKKHHMQLGLDEDTFVWLAGFYKACIEAHGFALGTIMFQLAIDETVIMPTLTVSADGMYLEGSCGLKGTDGHPHVCAPIRIPIGTGFQGYLDMCEAVEKYVIAHCKCTDLGCPDHDVAGWPRSLCSLVFHFL